MFVSQKGRLSLVSITPVAFRSQAHLLLFVVHELVRVSITARGCLSFCLCVHLSRVCFASCEEKGEAYRLFRVLWKAFVLRSLWNPFVSGQYRESPCPKSQQQRVCTDGLESRDSWTTSPNSRRKCRTPKNLQAYSWVIISMQFSSFSFGNYVSLSQWCVWN